MPDEGFHAALSALVDPALVMSRAVHVALELLPGAEGASVELTDGDRMLPAYAAGTLSNHLGLRLGRRGSLSGLCVETGSTLHCEDAQDDPRVDRDAAARVGARSIVCVPLTSAGTPVGVLKVSSSLPHAFDDPDLSTLSALSAFVVAAITAANDLEGAARGPLGVRRGPRHDGDAAAGGFIERVLGPAAVEELERARRIRAVVAERSFAIVHQPIFDLASGCVVMSEALTRFPTEPIWAPEAFFRDAWRVGIGAELELATARAALVHLSALPEGCRLAINLSPRVVESDALGDLLERVDPSHVVVEITEHDEPEDYGRTRAVLDPLRARGLQVAVDDTGNGFSSLGRILELSPDVIKLDRSLVQGLAFDPVKRSLATAMVAFARDVHARVVAEGVETLDDLESLVRLGVQLAQGHLLALPGPVEQVAATDLTSWSPSQLVAPPPLRL